MVRNIEQSTNVDRFIPKTRLRYWVEILIILIPMILIVGCRSSGESGSQESQLKKEVSFKDNETLYTKWDEIFEDDTIIDFTFNSPEEELFTIGGLSISPNGDYIIIDGKAKKIYQFAPDGKIVRTIGGYGEGPGEYIIGGRPYFDKGKNLYIYDVLKRHLIKYRYPDYEFEKNIRLPVSIQYYIIDDHNDFIVYTTSEPHLIEKISSEGEALKKAFNVDDINFRKFSARFTLGRVRDVPGKGIIFSYQDEYKIYYCDYNLAVKQTFFPAKSSEFFPGPIKYPSDLNPFEFTKNHSKWWSESMKPGGLFYLGGDYILQEIIKYTNLSGKYYVNLHDLDGKVYAVGVEVPFDGGIIRFVKDKYIYIVEPATFNKDDKIQPLKLHRFKLKNMKK